ncbi:MAG: hypothetical protein Kow0079_13240 [Vicingaceae bacterium]
MVYQKDNLAQNQAIRSANATKKSYFFTKKIAFAPNIEEYKNIIDSALGYIALAIQINDSAFKSAFDTCLYAKEQLLTAKDAQVNIQSELRKIHTISNINDVRAKGLDLVYLSANAMVDIYDASLHLMRVSPSENKDHGAMYKNELATIDKKAYNDRNVSRLEVDEHSFITLKELYKGKLTTLEIDIVELEAELETTKNAEDRKEIQSMIAEKKDERAILISKYNNADNKLVMVRNELSEDILNVVNKEIFSTDKKFYDKNVPIPNNVPVKGLVYRVQVGFFMNELPPEHFEGLFPLSTEKVDNVYMRYIAGSFPTYEDASDAKLAIVDKGYTDAFVVAYYDGKKISVAEAIKIEHEEK